jgi:hypothetical protein
MLSSVDHRAGIAKENHGRVFHEMVQFSPNELQAGGWVDRQAGFMLFHSVALLCYAVFILIIFAPE